MKTYIKPSLKVQNVLFESPMMNESQPGLSDEEASNGTVYTGSHRSSWGNLWGVED